MNVQPLYGIFVGLVIAYVLSKALRKPVHFYQYSKKLIRYVDASNRKVWIVIDFSFDGRYHVVQAYVPGFLGLGFLGHYHFGPLKEGGLAYPLVGDGKGFRKNPLQVRRALASQYSKHSEIYKHILNCSENMHRNTTELLVLARVKYCRQTWWNRKFYLLPL